MTGPQITEVDPGELHLPGSRQEGADPAKLHRQISRYGRSKAGMPPILVSRTIDGQLIINDGVTRATRVAKLSPGTTVPAQVMDAVPIHSSGYAKVREKLP